MITGSATHRILAAIRLYYREFGASPSHGELERRTSVKRQHVPRHLKRLQDQGYLTWTPGEPNSIVLAMAGDGLCDLDLESACHARGWAIDRSRAPVLVEAHPLLPGVPKWGVSLLQRLDDTGGA